MDMTQEQVELISIKTVEHAVEKFSDVVSEKIDIAIKLHEAKNISLLDEKLAKHIKECPVGQTIQLTTKKIVVASILFIVLSGASAEISQKIIEIVVKLL
jgi:hypothetical protein